MSESVLKSHRYILNDKSQVVPLMLHYLEQTPEVAEQSYDLLIISLSRDGEITDQEWQNRTERRVIRVCRRR